MVVWRRTIGPQVVGGEGATSVGLVTISSSRSFDWRRKGDGSSV